MTSRRPTEWLLIVYWLPAVAVPSVAAVVFLLAGMGVLPETEFHGFRMARDFFPGIVGAMIRTYVAGPLLPAMGTCGAAQEPSWLVLMVTIPSAIVIA